MTETKSANSSHRSFLKSWTDGNLDDSSPIKSAMHYLARVLLITIREFKKSELSLRSSALTYTILLSLVPMLALSTALIKGLGGGNHLREIAYTYIESLETGKRFDITASMDNPAQVATQSNEKASDLTSHLRSAIDMTFDYVDGTNFAALGTIGVVGILFSVLLVLGHIESAMNAIWKVSKSRSILRKIADYLTLILLLPLSINVAFAAAAFIKSPALATKLDGLIPFDWLQSLLLKPLPIFFITLTFFVMYIFFPNTKVRALPAFIGASLASLLWFTMQNAYISLQLGVSKYNAIYGSFATLPLFLIWIYLGWIFILSGAQVAFAVQNEKGYKLGSFKGSPSLYLGAAFDVMEQIYLSFSSRKGLTAQNLADNLPQYPQTTVNDTVDRLVASGVLHISQSDNLLFPTSPLEQYDRQKIVTIILGSESTDTAGGLLSSKAIEAAAASINYSIRDVASSADGTLPQ